MDEEFTVYTSREEGSSNEVHDIITYFILTCNGVSYIATSKSLTYRVGLRAANEIFLEVRGVTS